jgi:hypothetical protein
LVPVVRRSVVHPVASLSLPMMVSVSEVSSAGGASQETTGVKVVGAGPRLGDDAVNLLWDLVAHGDGIFGCAAPGDVASAPRSQRPGGIWHVLTGFF